MSDETLPPAGADARDARRPTDAFELQLHEDAEHLFAMLCEGEGEHTEALDVALITAAFRNLLSWAAAAGAAARPAEKIDLEPIKARLHAATEGPWTNGIRGSGSMGDAHMCRIIARGHEAAKNHNIAGAQIGATWDAHYVVSYVGLSRQACIDNAEFMAHAREDVPALIAEIERLRLAADGGARPAEHVQCKFCGIDVDNGFACGGNGGGLHLMVNRPLAADGGAVSRPQENTETTKTDEARSPSTATISRAGSTARAEGET